ncbi:MAG TPA: YitT family protein [Candidatus Cloacimonadota bacterium]|nr:YitT family protein [Candidatus Cloacimonadota bacterium]HQL14228.1 YitT family protein [Candidatus Cloacimonadota bacterium]
MNKRKIKLGREIEQYFGILIGAVLFGMGYAWFLIPYNIAPGGVGGIAQIFHYFFGFPVGITMICINIPLFVISFIYIGKSFGAKSIYGMLVSSFMTDLLSLPSLFKIGMISNLEKYTFIVKGHLIYAMLAPSDIYLSAIAGSVLLGLGLGIIFRFRGSTGGTDIPVAMIKQKAGISIGTGYWLVETFIILIVGISLKDLKLVIWGFLNLFITTKITDLASEGLPYIKGVYVISPAVNDIKQEIFDKLDRGVTFFKGISGYTQKEINILFCVVNRRQVSELSDIVKDIDKDAFMIVTEVHDVMGYGFRSRQLNLKDNG